jgi:hypothetical protein
LRYLSRLANAWREPAPLLTLVVKKGEEVITKQAVLKKMFCRVLGIEIHDLATTVFQFVLHPLHSSQIDEQVG